MCAILNFFKNIFVKNENIEEEVVSEMNSNEETTPETNDIPADDTVPVVNEEPISAGNVTYSGSNFVVLLDNGHAKSTAGKRSPLFEDGSRLYEYEFNRAVVAKIAIGLDKLHIKYHILVPEVEEDIPLNERVNRANKYCKQYGTKNCLFISVHSNACGDGVTFNSGKGWSIYTTKGDTKSDEYATIFHNVAREMLPKYGFTTREDMSDGDPDYEENFTVIYKTRCPAVLTENLFFTNRKECEWLRTEEGRQVIADIHIEAIRRIIDAF